MTEMKEDKLLSLWCILIDDSFKITLNKNWACYLATVWHVPQQHVQVLHFSDYIESTIQFGGLHCGVVFQEPS